MCYHQRASIDTLLRTQVCRLFPSSRLSPAVLPSQDTTEDPHGRPLLRRPGLLRAEAVSQAFPVLTSTVVGARPGSIRRAPLSRDWRGGFSLLGGRVLWACGEEDPSGKAPFSSRRVQQGAGFSPASAVDVTTLGTRVKVCASGVSAGSFLLFRGSILCCGEKSVHAAHSLGRGIIGTIPTGSCRRFVAGGLGEQGQAPLPARPRGTRSSLPCCFLPKAHV